MLFCSCIDGIWTLWDACWKCQSQDGWECDASIRWWRRGLFEKSCHTYLWCHKTGIWLWSMFQLIIAKYLYFAILTMFNAVTYTLHRKLKVAKKENQNIRSGETTMIWMNTFGMWFLHFFLCIFHTTWYTTYLSFFLSNCRSVDCFRLGWPMRIDADFFCMSVQQLHQDKVGVRHLFVL